MTPKDKYLKVYDEWAGRGPFAANWDSLAGYRVPQWFQDAKFGIFVHWGVYAVPAFGNEWYPRNMYVQGSPEYKHHLKTYGPHTQFGYKDFIPMFKAEKFDADDWATLFRKAGARYVVPVAEHHDGFAMYDSSFSKWCATKMGPRRDLIGELAQAVRRQNLVLGLSNHRLEHWFFMDGGKTFDSDVRDPKYADFYGPAEPMDSPIRDPFTLDWLARVTEMIEKYQPQLLYFDWWVNYQLVRRHLEKLAAYYYNRGAAWDAGVVLNYKENAFPPGTAVYDIERGIAADIRPMYWQTDTAVGKNSWGYVENMEYKTPQSLVGDLVDIVSKNGGLLLNIGPRADGTIPREDREILLAIGRWLAANGEAIYAARPWRTYGEGPTGMVEGGMNEDKRAAYTARDIRFTTRDLQTLYAIGLAWPENGTVTIRTLGSDLPFYRGRIEAVELLGAKAQVKWSRTPTGLTVKLPAADRDGYAFTLKISGRHS